ncbi:SDR family NAD(P)-dependent oxidoreductase, partial [Tsukamurella soli]
MELRDAHVLVTGASGGIGEALTAAFAARGARLTVTGRRPDALAGLAARFGAAVVAADLSEPDAPHRLLDAAGPVDVLVANAGLPASGLVAEYSIAEIDRALDVNLRAPIVLARLVADGMAERGRGHIVFMSSLSGKAASGRMALYNATKFGIRGFALGLREDLRPMGIGVSAVYPGPVRDGGMFAGAGVHVPRATTRTPGAVAAATVRAVERDRAEVTVAP